MPHIDRGGDVVVAIPTRVPHHFSGVSSRLKSQAKVPAYRFITLSFVSLRVFRLLCFNPIVNVA